MSAALTLGAPLAPSLRVNLIGPVVRIALAMMGKDGRTCRRCGTWLPSFRYLVEKLRTLWDDLRREVRGLEAELIGAPVAFALRVAALARVETRTIANELARYCIWCAKRRGKVGRPKAPPKPRHSPETMRWLAYLELADGERRKWRQIARARRRS